MATRVVIVLERPVPGGAEAAQGGIALGRIVEAHPALEPLLDFVEPDPRQIAAQIGVSYVYDPDDAADLAEIAFGPPEWYEPTAGLTVIQQALEVVRGDPGSVAAATYDPGLRPEDVLADLEALGHSLYLAQRHETRFHLLLTE